MRPALLTQQSARQRHVTLCQISDVHLAASESVEAGSPDAGLEHALELVAAEQPDGIVLTGDITDDGSLAACMRARSLVNSLAVPVVATPGNHDLPETVRAVFGDAEEMRLGTWRVQCVDTTIGGNDAGRIDVGAVAEALGPNAGVPTVLAMHHPPLTTSANDGFQLHRAPGLVAMLMERSDVRVVLSGHLHEAFAVMLGEVAYIGCSSSYYSLKHHGDGARRDEGHVGALLLRLHDDGAFQWRRLPETPAGERFDKLC